MADENFFSAANREEAIPIIRVTNHDDKDETPSQSGPGHLRSRSQDRLEDMSSRGSSRVFEKLGKKRSDSSANSVQDRLLNLCVIQFFFIACPLSSLNTPLLGWCSSTTAIRPTFFATIPVLHNAQFLSTSRNKSHGHDLVNSVRIRLRNPTGLYHKSYQPMAPKMPRSQSTAAHANMSTDQPSASAPCPTTSGASTQGSDQSLSSKTG
jgi:hypothetical protein